MCRLTCNLCWALDSDLVCPMHRQLTPNHVQQIVSGIQWVYTLVIPSTGHWTLQVALQSHMLVKSVCIHSDSPFPVTVKMDTNYVCGVPSCIS